MEHITFISAGAGSGKTYRLTEILSERLATRRVRPEAVIATTFTRKAAAGLTQRVRQRLIRDGHYVYANSIGQAYIGTVNSVCGQLLARYAFEAGLSPHLEVLGEQDDTVVFAQALDDAMSSEDIGRLNAIAQRLEIDGWRATVQAIVALARANDMPPEMLPAQAERSLEELFAYYPDPIESALDDALRDAVVQAIADISTNDDETKGTKTYLDLLHNSAHRIHQGRLTWSDWVRLAGKKPTKRSAPFAEPVAEAASRYDRHPGLHGDIRDWTRALFDLAARAMNTYRMLKAERGVMDFVDQEHELLALLDNPDVASSIREELDLLLVDEFQDTSPIQLAVFIKLAALAKECIWVGDIKQAIYGFRGSNPELMKVVVDALETTGGPIEILKSSWRSRSELVELANALFIPAFDKVLSEKQVRLNPQRKETLDHPVLRFWTLEGSSKGKRANALARAIGSLLDSETHIFDKTTEKVRPIRAGDIAVLSRSNAGAADYATALSAAGIAVSLERPGLLSTPEVHLALACVRRLIDPYDTLASAEIVALECAGEPEEWLHERLEYLARDNPSARWRLEGDHSQPALLALEALRPRLTVLSPSEVLDEALGAADVYRDAKAWGPTGERANQRLANLESLRGLSLEYESHCANQGLSATVSGLLLWLHDLADNKLDSHGAHNDGDAVQVLTHHRAKGLEWPVVIPADLESSVRGRLWGLSVPPDERDFSFDAPLANRRLRYWAWPFGKLSANIPIASRVTDSDEHAADLARETREAVRLLYVSFTRARDVLILPLQAGEKDRPWLNTLAADWLQPVDDALALPGGGSVSSAHETFECLDESPHSPAREDQRWFPPAVEPAAYAPAFVSPSMQPPLATASIGKVIELGPRLSLHGRPEMDTVGDALHNILSAELIAPEHPDRKSMAGGVLTRFGLRANLDVDEILACVDRLRSNVAQQFKPVRILSEWPVSVRLDTGQILSGWIDLLIETDNGFIVIDHKSFPGERAAWTDKALSYSGQLDAYRDAVERATARPVLSQWVHFSVGGGLVEVTLAGAGS